jgi:dTDP-4-amino-4,6-dideoxygalactose transaminase
MPEGSPLQWPSFSAAEIEAVKNVLQSGKANYWTGSECRSFEKEFAAFAGTEKSVALANGTLALDAIWHALGIGQGDEIIVTPRSFVASASSIVMAGAKPVFADVDAESQNITPETVEPLITSRTKAILCVHLAGWPCDMQGFSKLVSGRDIALVEDCAQAHGARLFGKPVGSLSNAAAWSFCQDKIMSTGGEGGMVSTSDPELWSKIWSVKDHGKSYDAVYNREHALGFRWVHESIGSNWRMLEMQAAIGRVQLSLMDGWHASRKAAAQSYSDAWSQLEVLRMPLPPKQIEHAWYRHYAFVRPQSLSSGWSRDRIISEVNAKGVPCFGGSCSEMYLEKAFRDLGLGPKERLPVAKDLGETSLAFLVHPTLTSADIAKTCEVVSQVCRAAAA